MINLLKNFIIDNNLRLNILINDKKILFIYICLIPEFQ